jgi:hypothetical protein
VIDYLKEKEIIREKSVAIPSDEESMSIFWLLPDAIAQLSRLSTRQALSTPVAKRRRVANIHKQFVSPLKSSIESSRGTSATSVHSTPIKRSTTRVVQRGFRSPLKPVDTEYRKLIEEKRALEEEIAQLESKQRQISILKRFNNRASNGLLKVCK